MTDVSLFAAATGAPTADAGKLLRGVGNADREMLHKRAIEFEAVYLAQMLQPMFDDLNSTEPFGGGFGEDIWRSQQVQEYGKAIAQNGGIGIADVVARELIQAQESHQATRS